MPVNVAIGALYFCALTGGIWRGPRPAVVWLIVGLGVPYVISYRLHGLFLWYRYPSVIFPAFLILVTAGGMALSSLRWRVLLFSTLLVYSAWGCWTYFTTFQKANPKAVVTYVDALESSQAVVVRPAYFSELFSFYDRGGAPGVDQNTLDTVEKRAALKGKQVILLAFDVPSDPIGEALRSEFAVVSQRHFPGYARSGITVYELR